MRQGLLNDKEVTIELKKKKLQLNNLNPMMEQMMDVVLEPETGPETASDNVP